MIQLKVRNIDVACEEHPDGFGVNWDGKLALFIAPAESKIVDEYIGRHYAKKLVEHLLLSGASYSDKKLTENTERRAALEAEVIEDVIGVPESNIEVIPDGQGHVIDSKQ